MCCEGSQNRSSKPIAISNRGLGARVGPCRGRVAGFVGAPTPPRPATRPSQQPPPCASLWSPIAFSPPSFQKSGWVIFYRLARRSRRAPRGQALSRSECSGACLHLGSPRGLARRVFASVGLGGALGVRLPSISCPPPSVRVQDGWRGAR